MTGSRNKSSQKDCMLHGDVAIAKSFEAVPSLGDALLPSQIARYDPKVVCSIPC